MIRMKMVLPNSNHDIRFECLESRCGDIVSSSRIQAHARQIHHTDEVLMDTTAAARHERRNPMCGNCGHSMWFHAREGVCSKCPDGTRC